MKISPKVKKQKTQTTKKTKQKFGPLLFSVELVHVYKHSDVTSSLWFHSVELIFEYTGNKLRYCRKLENHVHSSLFLFKGVSCEGMQLCLGEAAVIGVCHGPAPVPKPEELVLVPGMAVPGSTLSSLLPEIFR